MAFERVSILPFRERWRRHRGQLFLLVVLAALSLALMSRGKEFYALDIETRVDHKDFRVLSPGSPVGHGYGIAGTFLILTNLLYLARRRLARWHLGSMRTWLNIHVFTGLFGAVLVVFHSAFQLRSSVATLTAASLSLAVVTGLIGRYFYGAAPEPDPRHLLLALQGLDELSPGLARHIAAELAALSKPSRPTRASLLASLGMLPTWRAERKARARIVDAACEPVLAANTLGTDERRSLRRLRKEAAKRAAEPVSALAASTILRSWRGLHRFMALLMVLLVIIHISVAWVFGYRWLLSE